MDDVFLKEILPNVQKPARYLGNEVNSIHKPWESVKIHVALSYPDAYEIGMSNLGVQILYHIINLQADAVAERVFAPWPDLEQLLTTQDSHSHSLLTTLESRKPLKEFELIGFSLGHELTYTNIVTILKLGGIPLRAAERGETDPLVLGGGPCVFNPEPVAEFFDFIVIGEAEEVFIQIINEKLKMKNEGRMNQLKELAKIEGIYVPSLHNPVKKRIIKDLDAVPYPTKPIIPFIETIHDRAALEIMRGCKWNCKFCQAGWTYRPVRERDADRLIGLADELIRNTGYNELSLISLSSSDYREIERLAKTLAKKYEPDRINVSLPSMRTNTFSVSLAREISRVRPSGVTLAPEAGSQRLRDLIGKNMTEEHILDGVKSAFEAGIESIKLYFMIGLPTETDADRRAIGELARKILAQGKAVSRRARVTVNLATFIPKAQTPFQWEAQISIEETLRRQKFIKETARGKGIEVRWHQAEASWLEGVFARGDRRLTAIIEKAWGLGARFDAWSEHFKLDLWQKAFADCQVNADEYLKARPVGEPLPWDYIDTGVPKEVLSRAARPS